MTGIPLRLQAPSHPLIQEYIAGVTSRPAKRRSHAARSAAPSATVGPRRSLRNGKDALLVNWFEIEILDAAGKLNFRNSYITDLPVGPENVAELAACGRARWKIENETFNVLKTKGYNIEHNFGHGKHHLAAVLAT